MLARLLTIVGAGREGWVVLRRGREKTVCARAPAALVGRFWAATQLHR